MQCKYLGFNRVKFGFICQILVSRYIEKILIQQNHDDSAHKHEVLDIFNTRKAPGSLVMCQMLMYHFYLLFSNLSSQFLPFGGFSVFEAW